jgi:hypothetical protein
MCQTTLAAALLKTGIYQITDTTEDSACTTVECTFQAELGSATCFNHKQSGDAVVVL